MLFLYNVQSRGSLVPIFLMGLKCKSKHDLLLRLSKVIAKVIEDISAHGAVNGPHTAQKQQRENHPRRLGVGNFQTLPVMTNTHTKGKQVSDEKKATKKIKKEEK